MQKTLLFNNYTLQTTDGGPSGLIAQNFLNANSDLFVINDRIINKPQKKILRLLKKILPTKKYQSFFYTVGLDKTNRFADWLYPAQKIYQNVNARNFPKIIFFDVFNLAACLPLIPNNQIVILNPVTPELASSETAFQKGTFTENDIIWSKKAEELAFKRANVLIFANKGAQRVNQSLISKNSKIYYLHHGALPVSEKKIIPLAENKINLLYIGRRIPIKGFDIIVEAFKQASLMRSDINLILVGNGSKVEGENIYDIGFSNTPHLWINSVDYVINCNRQSYFDLSVLETLSMGTPLIMSATWGHEVFKNFNSNGIIDVGEPTIENLKKTLISDKLAKKRNNIEAVKSNVSLFNLHFSKENAVAQLESFLECL